MKVRFWTAAACRTNGTSLGRTGTEIENPASETSVSAPFLPETEKMTIFGDMPMGFCIA
jgi:hypothetical protein